jgi:hypothetical protein
MDASTIGLDPGRREQIFYREMFSRYLREMKTSVGYMATWLPNVPLELGAIGIIDSDGRFRPETSLARLGLPPEHLQQEIGMATAPIQHTSNSDVTIDFKVAGSAPVTGSKLAEAEAGVSVGFTSENAVAFAAEGCAIDRFKDIESIGIELVARADAKLWKTSYVILTEIVRASSTTVLISSGQQARYDATVTGSLKPGAVSIASPELGLSYRHATSIGTSVLAQQNLTPLFNAYRVKSTWFRGNRWVFAKGAKGSSNSPLEALSVSAVLGFA